jgi:hypothetical protein
LRDCGKDDLICGIAAIEAMLWAAKYKISDARLSQIFLTLEVAIHI